VRKFKVQGLKFKVAFGTINESKIRESGGRRKDRNKGVSSFRFQVSS
jgi:hypothetical protein